MALEEMLVKVLAKRKGIPEEEAKLLLESMKDDDEYEELKKTLATVADVGAVMQNMPPTIQPLAAPLITQTLMSAGGGSSKAAKIAENVALISAAIRAAYGDDGNKDEHFLEIIRELKEEIKELKEEKMKREQEQLVQQITDTISAISEYMKALEDRIAQIEESKNKTPVEKQKDEIDLIEEYLEKLEKTKEKLKKLGLIKEAEDDGSKLDLSKAEELLRKAGYRIEKPLTWETLHQYIEEQVKKVKEEAKKEAMEELKVKERQMAMITDLIQVCFGSAIEALASKSNGTSSTLPNILERFQQWKQVKEGSGE